MGVTNSSEETLKIDQTTLAKLATYAIIHTSTYGEVELEDGIIRLLKLSRVSARIAIFDSDDPILIEELERWDISAIVVFDDLMQPEESCKVRNAMRLSARLSEIPTQTLSIFRPSKDPTSPAVGSMEEMLLNVISNKRN